MTGLSLSTLQKMRSQLVKDPIPFTRIGRSIRYRQDLLMRWLERNTFLNVQDYIEKDEAG
jgi:hypothetical protein